MRDNNRHNDADGLDKAAPTRAHIVALAIHGGAGGTTTPDMPPPLLAAYRRRLRIVLDTTYGRNHASSLDAVCDAVSQLEDSPLFNAGKGAVFDLSGQTVCESSLMTTQPGFNSATIAVTGVRRTKNPILLSRILLERNRELGGHAFYSGSAAERAGWKHGAERVSKHYYWTKRRWNEHKRGLDTKLADLVRDKTAHDSEEKQEDQDGNEQGEGAALPPYSAEPTAICTKEHEDQAVFDRYADLTDFLPQGTVGAVALDSHGHLSVATSTGGKTNKYPGRIGDTPSVGSGFWADSWPSPSASAHTQKPTNSFARLLRRIFCTRKPTEPSSVECGIAISGTGDGDFFLRTNFASSIAHRLRYGQVDFPSAIKAAMAELVALYGSPKGVGGAIILDRQGCAYFPLAASTMNRGLISQSTGFKARVAIFDHEELA